MINVTFFAGLTMYVYQ